MLATTVDSVTRSPLYSIYGETIAGVAVVRAFGASSKFLRDMICCADTVGDLSLVGLSGIGSCTVFRTLILRTGCGKVSLSVPRLHEAQR